MPTLVYSDTYTNTFYLQSASSVKYFYFIFEHSHSSQPRLQVTPFFLYLPLASLFLSLSLYSQYPLHFSFLFPKCRNFNSCTNTASDNFLYILWPQISNFMYMFQNNYKNDILKSLNRFIFIFIYIYVHHTIIQL